MYIVTERNIDEAQRILEKEFKCSIYKSEYGWGFTGCEADCYENALEATIAAIDVCFAD